MSLSNDMGRDGGIADELNELGSGLVPHINVPYALPDGYFAVFNDMVMAGVHSLPVSREGKMELPYIVNPHYFDALPERMLVAVTQTPGQNKSSLSHRPAFSRSLRWAMAAMLAAIMVFGGYIAFTGASVNGTERMLSHVEKNAITNYLQVTYGMDEVSTRPHFDDVAIDNEEIVKYLNETGWD